MISKRLARAAVVGCAGLALWMNTSTAFAAFTSGSPPLLNHGGRTQNPSLTYAIYWGEQWNVGWPDVDASTCAGAYFGVCNLGSVPEAYTNAAQTTMNYVTTFLSSAVPASSWIGSQSQYGAGASWGGSWVDSSSVPPATPGLVTDSCTLVCLVDQPPGSAVYTAETTLSELGTEALHAEAHFGYSPNADYMIFLPKGTSPGGFGVYCAYHNEIYDASGNRISYSVIPYLPDANQFCGENYLNAASNSFGNGFLDGYSIVAGHELAETATDALPFTATGWQDSSGEETGDICAWGTSTDGVPMYNISGGGHVFAVQSLWSNSANTCV